jgi:hypothetical protein
MEIQSARISAVKLTESNGLCCPKCGENNLHQCGVQVFNRDREDAQTGKRVEIEENSRITIDSSMEGNPSCRRDGLRIVFYCEHCHGDDFRRFSLVIEQHKGTEFVYWENVETEE